MRNLILVVGVLCCASLGHSQMPAGWNVNPSAYNYSMTLTGKIFFDCTSLNNANNAIAAFVGSQCRGVAYTDVDAAGNNLGYLVINSNQVSGELVELRFYDALTGLVHTSIDGVTFLTNQVVGTIANPFVVTTNHRPTNLHLSNYVVQEGTPIGGYIATTIAMDQDLGQILTYSLPTGLMDNSLFTITGDNLELNTVLDFALQDSFQIVVDVNDGQGCNLVDTFFIIVDDNAFPPVAVNDTVAVDEDNLLVISPLLNDTDYDNDIDTSSVSIFADAQFGATTVLSNGTVEYLPSLNYFGPDTITYIICDLTNTGAMCDTAQIVITVNPVPDAPVAMDDTISTDEDVAVDIPVLANDTDVENDINPSSVSIFIAPNHGVATVLPNGEINYLPNPLYNGFDTLTYIVCDATLPTPLCDTAIVVITVNQVPNTPLDILIDTLFLTEDNVPNFKIGTISTLDYDLPADDFIYTLVSGTNDSDNAQFNIIGSELFIETKTNAEIKPEYNIRIRTTDSFGLWFEKPFNVTVIDIEGNEIPLPVATYISNNKDGKNDFFAVENVTIYNQFQLQVFDQFGTVVYEKENNYNNDFDGVVNGNKLPTGAYYYLFQRDGKKYTGNITIVN